MTRPSLRPNRLRPWLVVAATLPELDDIYSLLEDLADATRSARRRDLLDALRASLSVSMDGF